MNQGRRSAVWGVLFGLLGLFVTACLPHLFELHEEVNSQRKITPSPVLLLTAHPDDEVMFFAPTLRALRKQDVEIKVLCLSNGNAEGLGAIRERELGDSLDVLGIGRENGAVINHPSLKDNMTLLWDSEIILSFVKPFLTRHIVKTIFTFDSYGISGHPNHISLSNAVDLLPKQRTSFEPELRVYHLVSRNRVIKYTGALLMPYTFLSASKYRLATFMDPEGYLQALRAMRQHRSQLLWFRYLYIIFSRYMYINEWEESIPNHD